LRAELNEFFQCITAELDQGPIIAVGNKTVVFE
jgi:hypothetical protein